MMKLLLTSLLLFGMAGSFTQARASLGGNAASIDSDQIALGGTQRTTITKPNYSIEEITTKYGVIREFLSTSGKVFAVSWAGQSHPDMAPILGSSFQDYKTAVNRPQRLHNHHHRKITMPSKVLVEHRGHMRKVEGRAVDPSLMPQGVSTNDIQ